MKKSYQYFKNHEKTNVIKRMDKYKIEKPEMDKFLEEKIISKIQKKAINILDAGCGNGYLSNNISKLSPNSKIVGVDQTDYLIKEARQA